MSVEETFGDDAAQPEPSSATVSTTAAIFAGCSKRPFSKAAASEEARRTLRYVESLSDAKTPNEQRRVLTRQCRAGEKGDFLSILLKVDTNGSRSDNLCAQLFA